MINIAENPVILFTSPDQRYHFARWGRPIAPVVFGVGDENLPHLKDAIAMTVGISGGMLVDTDPELGANFMWFFCRDWDEMLVIPDLDKLIPNFVNLITELQEKNATRYRSFGFEKNGASSCVLC